MRTYGIKSGYRCNLESVQPLYSDEASIVYQDAVYQYALATLQEVGVKSVLDGGCGLGLKLEKYFAPTGVDIVCVDTPETIALCKKRHSFGQLISDDLENPNADLEITFDLLICSDVIEHLIDPDRLLAYLQKWAAPKATIILSTPERDMRRGVDHMGPPQNKSHVREWNKDEFGRYLTSRGLSILDHRIVESNADNFTCQLVKCQGSAITSASLGRRTASGANSSFFAGWCFHSDLCRQCKIAMNLSPRFACQHTLNYSGKRIFPACAQCEKNQIPLSIIENLLNRPILDNDARSEILLELARRW